ncbi:hypothetical protein WMF30_37280 [Sorangium sp. So ce134]
MNIRDPKHRMSLTFPGPPITRGVSPLEIESYLRAKGYEPAILDARSWPKHLPYSWYPPAPHPVKLSPYPRPSRVPGTRECSRPLEEVIEAIARNEERTAGEVLGDIKALAREFAKVRPKRAKKPGR